MVQEFNHPLLDLRRLGHWMDEQRLEHGPILDPVLLSGGKQNVILRFQRGERSFVLRRPPEHPIMDGNETMRREARILRAIAGSDVPHAPLIAACPTDGVLGAAFYLMEPVDGFNVFNGLPSPHADDPSMRYGMGMALIDGLLALGGIDSNHPELTGLGRPGNFLERQVNRWHGQLEGYRKFEGWTGLDELGDIDHIAQWLAANCPATFLPGLVHGDFHIGNVMYRRDGPGLAAIFDWELGTIGDPLLDLANLIATWPDENGGHTVSRTVEPWEGFPTIAAMIAHYSANTRRDMREFQWYAVLACYRLGIVVEGTHARACAGKASSEIGAAFHRTAIRVLKRSHRWIEHWPYGDS